LKNVYDPAQIETRWQAHWEAQKTFQSSNPGDPGFDPKQPKYYVLDMFPYPSGAGLHVGHPMGYIGSDIVARRKRMDGFNVLHPIGYDAFGLPAEQYAILTGQHPAETTADNIATFRRQLKSIGLSYDWSRELTTSDPRFYRWTQWIFARLFDAGLAYQTEVPVWWCDELKTVLSNEEVISGRSERGDYPCVKRPLSQWMLRITSFADRLIEDLDDVDWPESVKTMQREWIGRSEGAEIDFSIAPADGAGAAQAGDERLRVFTTRPDTIFGATFMVIAPEHPLLNRLTSSDKRAEVDAYIAESASKSDLERTDLAKDKTGVFTGSYCLNPLMDPGQEAARIPVFVADYVLIGYGTGAIMAVPGGDERDMEFARKYDLPIRRVVEPPAESGLGPDDCFAGDGRAVDSPGWNGLGKEAALARSIEVLTEGGHGCGKVTYRLRDWLFSRQRYWGEPFPILHHADGSLSRVPDGDLPVLLPRMDDFEPSADGAPPLSKATDWVATTDPTTGAPVQRNTDTMPGWAGSCWYYLRYMDPGNDNAPFAPDAERYWENVDLYVGGTEHAVLHLLYARFWHKFLYDQGVVHTKEPFKRLFNQGMITAFAYKDAGGRKVPVDEVEFDGELARLKSSGEELERITAKMSKTLKNVVNPDDVCAEFGVDTFRLYEMFMGPLAESKPWNPRDVPGCRRFLERTWKLFVDPEGEEPVRAPLLGQDPVSLDGPSEELERHWNRALVRIEGSFQAFNFNTAIAAFMSFVNEATKRQGAFTPSQARRFVLALSPFAPHVAEDLWQRLGHAQSLAREPWPVVDESYLVDESFELVVQVLGKVRGRVQAPKDADKAALEVLARAAVADKLEGKQVVKVIVVPGRLVNFVVR
jgi:leucyl-tRNA synthetase